MNLKSSLRVVAIGILIGGFASLVKIPTKDESIAPPKTELQKLLADKQYETALRSANDAVRQNPQDIAALLAKGVALTALNQRPEAVSLYQKMIKDFPESAEPFNNLAALYASEGKYENARLALEKAMQIQGSYAVAYKNLNAIYAKLADQAYNKALETGTEKSPAPLQLSLLTELGQPGKQAFVVAMSQFEQAKPVPEKKPIQLAKAPVEELAPKLPPPIPTQTVAPLQPASTPPTVTSPSKTIPVAVLTTEGKDSKADSKKQDKADKPSISKPEKTERAPEKGEREAIEVVQAWASAWSKQDIKAYLSYYASNFDPGNQSRSAWESDRRARIGGKARISVTVSDLSVSLKSATSASVKFRQSYRSDRLNSHTGKTLVLERKSDGWRIVQEKTGG